MDPSHVLPCRHDRPVQCNVGCRWFQRFRYLLWGCKHLEKFYSGLELYIYIYIHVHISIYILHSHTDKYINRERERERERERAMQRARKPTPGYSGPTGSPSTELPNCNKRFQVAGPLGRFQARAKNPS